MGKPAEPYCHMDELRWDAELRRRAEEGTDDG